MYNLYLQGTLSLNSLAQKSTQCLDPSQSWQATYSNFRIKTYLNDHNNCILNHKYYSIFQIFNFFFIKQIKQFTRKDSFEQYANPIQNMFQSHQDQRLIFNSEYIH